MSSSKIRRAFGAVKDQTSISLAKVSSSNLLADLDVAIVKATRHEEHPAEERHVREILSLTSYSRAYISSCVNTLSRRLTKTKNWIVAIKTLMLIQRLLAEGDPAYEQEIFFATRRGTRLLNLSDFCDGSRTNSWDYSAFVRTYALYLDERLEFKMQGRRGKRSAFAIDEDRDRDQDQDQDRATSSEHLKSTPIRDMKIDLIFSRTQHLQQLLDRFLACRPTGGARQHRLVLVALYPTLKESFQVYYDVTEILGILIDRFMELEINDSIKVYEIFCRVLKQFEELDHFYSWCKTVGIARSSEYPEVEKITQKKLDLMDEFIRDKSALAQIKTLSLPYGEVDALEIQRQSADHKEDDNLEEEQQQQQEETSDMNSIKALPPPETVTEEKVEPEPLIEEKDTKKEVDLLNLGEDALSREENENNLALALFDAGVATTESTTVALQWEAFNEGTGDWETALVQSASSLQTQKATLGGGFDMLVLDGMYQGATNATTIGYIGSGSASSVALGSAGQLGTAMLALPAPPQAVSEMHNLDPFAASLVVAPPSFVQMSDMEKKQKLLMEEQLMWQQYARERSYH
ncbi:ENTH/ANTH/VHS superfamily protein [Euphorbia peplus]|nr:ENTH/ANTH/VHS superfamily protein [Euphorbia peplus]